MTRSRYLLLLSCLLVIFLAGCSSASFVQRSDHSEIFSPAMGRYMPYAVYTPPAWSPSEQLPLMILLHGARDSYQSFDRHGVGLALDQAIAARRAPRMIIVVPEGELGFWENWHDGSKRYRDWVVRDLLPVIGRRYNTLACPNDCYLSGVSMGGHGVMRFAYYEPNTFASVAAISTPIISKLHPGKPSFTRTLVKWLLPTKRIWGDINDGPADPTNNLDPYVGWVKRDDLRQLLLLLVWGTDDSKDIISANQRFQQHLKANGKTHAWFTYEGGHKWTNWRDIMADVLNFHAGVRPKPIASMSMPRLDNQAIGISTRCPLKSTPSNQKTQYSHALCPRY